QRLLASELLHLPDKPAGVWRDQGFRRKAQLQNLRFRRVLQSRARLFSSRRIMPMQPRVFLRTGHAPTLACAFLYFDISFMVWVILGALANSIVPQFGLQPAQKGLMVSVPLLSGAVLRLPMGLLTDRIGARRTWLLGLGL